MPCSWGCGSAAAFTPLRDLKSLGGNPIACGSLGWEMVYGLPSHKAAAFFHHMASIDVCDHTLHVMLCYVMSWTSLLPWQPTPPCDHDVVGVLCYRGTCALASSALASSGNTLGVCVCVCVVLGLVDLRVCLCVRWVLLGVSRLPLTPHSSSMLCLATFLWPDTPAAPQPSSKPSYWQPVASQTMANNGAWSPGQARALWPSHSSGLNAFSCCPAGRAPGVLCCHGNSHSG